MTTKPNVMTMAYLYPNCAVSFKNFPSLSCLIIDLTLSSVTKILCFVVLKLKFSGLTKLPSTVIAPPTEMDAKFPTNSGIFCPVDEIEILPYSVFATNNQTNMPLLFQL